MRKLLLALTFLLFPIISTASDLDNSSFVRINTTMHNGMLTAAAVNESDTTLLTVSRDKTAKLWDIQTGQLLNTYRMPLYGDYRGELWAAAYDPKGRWVAVGGDTNVVSTYVYIINLDNGLITHQLEAADFVHAICVSPDGSRIAAVSNKDTTVWDTTEWNVVFNQPVESFSVHDCAFTVDNELLTTVNANRLRLFSKDGDLKEQKTFDHRVASIAFKADKQTFAVGTSEKTAKVTIGGLNPLKFINYDGDLKSKAMLRAVDWSIDDSTLYAGGFYTNEDGTYAVVRWDDVEQEGTPIGLSGHHGPINEIFAIDDNKVLSTSITSGWMLQTNEGRVLVNQAPEYIDGRALACEALWVNADGHKVYIEANTSFDAPLMIDLDQKKVSSAISSPENMHSAQTDGLPIINWKDNYPKLDGHKLALGQARESHCLAVANSNKSFVLSTKHDLRLFAKDGFLTWAKRAPFPLRGVNITADQRFVVSLSENGIIDWYSYEDGEKVLSMFVNKRTLEWIVWTPDGYYDASENGAELMGWQVNQGYSTPAFYTAKSLEKTFRQTEVINTVFGNLANSSKTQVSIDKYLSHNLIKVSK